MSRYKLLESPFQLLGHAVKRMEIENNVLVLDHNTVYVLNDLDVNITHCEERENEYIGNLYLEISLSCENKQDTNEDEDESVDDKIQLTCKLALEGRFAGEKEGEAGIKSIEDFRKMLMVNGTTSLYSIARSVLVTTTSQCLLDGQVRLPMINVLKFYAMKLEQEKRQKARKKKTKKNTDTK